MWHSGRYRGEFCAAPKKVDSSYFFFFFTKKLKPAAMRCLQDILLSIWEIFIAWSTTLHKIS
jgi:hypothetical protein